MTVQIISAASIGFVSNTQMKSMLTENDKALYYDIAKSYRGKGAVVEVGPWLGSGTYQIARGLDDSGKPWSMTVYDRFKWASLYETRYPELGLKKGDDFTPLFRENVAPYIDRITPIAGEVAEIGDRLPLAGPVELLFVDAPKNWQLLWAVLEHVRPHLKTGAKLVFQDFFHVGSRQIIWLLMSIPQLRLTKILESGSTVAFTVKRAIPPLDSFLPRDMAALGVADLLRMWKRLQHEFPERRSGGLAAGMAIDLLARDAIDEALAILNEGVIERPWHFAVADDLNRLVRPGGTDRNFLLEISAYLRTRIHPLVTRAARERAAAEWRALEAAKEEAPSSPSGMLDALDRKQIVQLSEEIRTPTTANSLALRHLLENGAINSRLFTVYRGAFATNAVAWPLQLADMIMGKDVVELGSGVTLHGLVMRGLGARSYVGVEPSFDPERRVYTSHGAAGTTKSKFAIGEICEMVSDLSYVADAAELGPDHEDRVLLAYLGAEVERVEQALEQAERLLPSDGRLHLWWRNPLSWSGHGRAPQLAAEFDPADPDHVAVADWAHLRKEKRNLANVTRLREAIESRFDVIDWVEEAEDPDATLRMTARVRKRLPDLPLHNFAIKSVLVVAQRRRGVA